MTPKRKLRLDKLKDNLNDIWDMYYIHILITFIVITCICLVGSITTFLCIRLTPSADNTHFIIAHEGWHDAYIAVILCGLPLLFWIIFGLIKLFKLIWRELRYITLLLFNGVIEKVSNEDQIDFSIEDKNQILANQNKIAGAYEQIGDNFNTGHLLITITEEMKRDIEELNKEVEKIDEQIQEWL